MCFQHPIYIANSIHTGENGAAAFYKKVSGSARKRERVLARPLKQFFPPERAAKKYMCAASRSAF
jgi:hypothetical protein